MRRHSTSTLMGLTKKELVEYVRMAEHNQDVAEETLKQQAENIKDWMPVRHGHWAERPVNVGTCTTGLFCSKCDFPSLGWKYNYCPNCGARMDGGAE